MEALDVDGQGLVPAMQAVARWADAEGLGSDGGGRLRFAVESGEAARVVAGGVEAGGEARHLGAHHGGAGVLLWLLL